MNMLNFQRGIGMIELMVAMTIALFLTLGLGTAFYGMSRTNKNLQGVPGSSNQGLSGLQDSERMAILFLDEAITAAGYYPMIGVPTSPFAVASAPFYPSQVITGSSSATGDSISIRFESDAVAGRGWQGCSGQATPSTDYTDTFSVVGNTLQCTENGVVYNLVNGLSGMTIRYGVVIASGLEYLPAGSVSAASPNWSAVRSVAVTLAFLNPLAQEPGQPAIVPYPFTRTFALMNGF